MRSKASARKRTCPPSDHFAIKGISDRENDVVVAIKEVEANRDMSMKTGEREVAVGGGGDDDAAGLQRAVKRLHFGGSEEKEAAAAEIEDLAKNDVKLRKLVAELGVIPVLVDMAASAVPPRRRAAVGALIQLANGTYT